MEKHIIIGAGPAGLTVAWQLVHMNRDLLVLEADPDYVGGIARTVQYKGNRFDMGGHRFYTKSGKINRLWEEMLPEDFLHVPRLPRIFYRSNYFPYPLQVLPTIRNLGLFPSIQIILSYVRARLFPLTPEESFEDWVVNRFGRRLYETFFKSYSEKVWGIPCTEISKDFVAQRIRGFSLTSAIKKAFSISNKREEVKTLITHFLYPRLGPGQLWELARDQVVARGGRVEMNKQVQRVYHKDGKVTKVMTTDGSEYEGTHFYSTMTLKDLINALDPPPPSHVAHAADKLKYRDFLTVALIYDKKEMFQDNWIYIHDATVKVGRIQNYKNWSIHMVADPEMTCLGSEYFCNQGDEFWNMEDYELIDLAAEEIETIGLGSKDLCVDGCVVRLANTYPLYDFHYRENRATIKEWLNGYFTNLSPAGRGGLHNYNSQDHSMMAAILAVQNLIGEDAEFDLWAINTDEEYAEVGVGDQGVEERMRPEFVKC